MKAFFSGIFFLLISILNLSAQEERISPPRESIAKLGDLTITLNYGSPSVKGRTIWGDLVSYEKVWRTGANEATTIEFSKDVKINGSTIKAGKYALFTIPGKEVWTIIINSEPNQWGAYKYNDKNDVVRFEVNTAKADSITEMLTLNATAKSTEIEISFAWENLTWKFNVSTL